MINYNVSISNKIHHLIDFEGIFPVTITSDSTILQLAAWRPGRYELGNFAKNIQKFSVVDQNGNDIHFEKTTKDRWKINSKGLTEIIVRYTYFAAELNAGSTYLDEEQLYINPVNCFLYNPDEINQPYQIHFNLPSTFQIASSLSKTASHGLKATSYEELADSPLIASATLQHHSFNVENLPIHIWTQGECRPDFNKIENDFRKFSAWQLAIFPECPTKEYHYLIQVLPVPFYHGVEHVNSTVLALGPGHAINADRYEDLLGVSCHEFYHVWNIKTIRPAEMWPYDYTKENYFTTGFVAEGVTTYMGDYILWQSDVFNEAEFFNELNNQLQKHFDNFGRFNHSVTQSGFETWLDGYVPGVPDRKVSIYTEGCLLALMTDIIIMKSTDCKKNLHDVMRGLYNNHYKKDKGYTYDDYVNLVSEIAGRDMRSFFHEFALTAKDYRCMLDECLGFLGLEIHESVSGNLSDSVFGFKLIDSSEKSVITAIHPESPVYKLLAVNDQLVSINGISIKGDGNKWINHFSAGEIRLEIFRNNKSSEVILKADGKQWYKIYSIVHKENSSQSEKKMFDYWKTKK